ncbi:MAG: LacI family DNA-binding transcriptional regulator [Acutalibacter sp.]|jgi:LacI family transcriptional regulator
MTQNKNPTMKDVAKAAGVSLGTVSNVINGMPVRQSSRDKVERAIQELHYEVNAYAQGFRKSQTGLVALIIPEILNPFYSAFTDYVAESVYAHGLKLLLCCSHELASNELAYLNLAKKNKVNGIIALTYSDIGDSISDDIPMVVFDRFFENHKIPRVGSDNFSGACLAVEKLLEFGCTHPVYVRFHSIYPGESDKRRDGYLYACKKHGLEPDYLDEVETGRSEEILKRFLEEHTRPDGTLTFDGVFAHTDYHGYAFKKILQRAGYRVPEDVQIIGFDGIGKFGHEDDLAISSICQPIRQLAEKCVESILAEDRSSVPTLTLLPVTYRYGGTTREPGKWPET